MLLFKSSLLIFASKSLAIASPWFLKSVVDSMAIVGSMDFNVAAIGIGMFGASRLISTMLQETRMLQISKFIQHGIRKISFDAFQHLHSLDLNYHKTSSKNTVFAINRALRSIDSGLRFTLGFFTPVAVEFLLLCFMLQFYCGPKYLGNMLFTLGLYTLYTKQISNYRREEMR
jgi:ABC-type bacteriocin/lantibiotic exporter with double-glycine peptidase domain